MALSLINYPVPRASLGFPPRLEAKGHLLGRGGASRGDTETWRAGWGGGGLHCRAGCSLGLHLDSSWERAPIAPHVGAPVLLPHGRHTHPKSASCLLALRTRLWPLAWGRLEIGTTPSGHSLQFPVPPRVQVTATVSGSPGKCPVGAWQGLTSLPQWPEGWQSPTPQGTVLIPGWGPEASLCGLCRIRAPSPCLRGGVDPTFPPLDYLDKPPWPESGRCELGWSRF